VLSSNTSNDTRPNASAIVAGPIRTTGRAVVCLKQDELIRSIVATRPDQSPQPDDDGQQHSRAQSSDEG
jgi:hypothetical protein